jgi:hypothetical protein
MKGKRIDFNIVSTAVSEKITALPNFKNLNFKQPKALLERLLDLCL